MGFSHYFNTKNTRFSPQESKIPAICGSQDIDAKDYEASLEDFPRRSRRKCGTQKEHVQHRDKSRSIYICINICIYI